MTEDEVRAVVRTGIRTEAKVKRLESLLYIALILLVAIAGRLFL